VRLRLRTRAKRRSPDRVPGGWPPLHPGRLSAVDDRAATGPGSGRELPPHPAGRRWAGTAPWTTSSPLRCGCAPMGPHPSPGPSSSPACPPSPSTARTRRPAAVTLPLAVRRGLVRASADPTGPSASARVDEPAFSVTTNGCPPCSDRTSRRPPAGRTLPDAALVVASPRRLVSPRSHARSRPDPDRHPPDPGRLRLAPGRPLRRLDLPGPAPGRPWRPSGRQPRHADPGAPGPGPEHPQVGRLGPGMRPGPGTRPGRHAAPPGRRGAVRPPLAAARPSPETGPRPDADLHLKTHPRTQDSLGGGDAQARRVAAGPVTSRTRTRRH
jgi:hypothetical protein